MWISSTRSGSGSIIGSLGWAVEWIAFEAMIERKKERAGWAPYASTGHESIPSQCRISWVPAKY